MRELFMKLFEMSHFDTGIQITPFSMAHIVYMVLMIVNPVVFFLAVLALYGMCYAVKGMSQKKACTAV